MRLFSCCQHCCCEPSWPALCVCVPCLPQPAKVPRASALPAVEQRLWSARHPLCFSAPAHLLTRSVIVLHHV